MLGEYVVAVRRDRRGAPTANWLDRLQRIPGVRVTGASSWRAQVETDEDGLARLNEQFGNDLLVEPLVVRRPL